ncbi:hypothetical protein ACI2KR_09125 [Pseudomonas luteola]
MTSYIQENIARYAFVSFDFFDGMRLKGFCRQDDERLHRTHYRSDHKVLLEHEVAMEMAEDIADQPEFQLTLIESPSCIIVIGDPTEGFECHGPFLDKETAEKAMFKHEFLENGHILEV